ncbi:hypothetical protein [Methylobacterium planeticum]|uniref:Uncharacterized protein n=1 Tax=Methylobacterium planeticum TaxID=2615211 RepID=A0A6N6MX97_9HYPH|nr:hypothetical protein [Methylobacterium planeticum]KAB1075346.1 hypothetical protein F6X51_05555 [Methylobacterium planeticum]
MIRFARREVVRDRIGKTAIIDADSRTPQGFGPGVLFTFQASGLAPALIADSAEACYRFGNAYSTP